MLEQLIEALKAHTAALIAHTAALAANPTAPATTRKTKATDTPPAGAAVAATATVSAPAATSQPVQSAAPAAQPSAAATVSAQAAGDAMVRVANELDREVAVQILAMFGAATFAGVKPADYAAFKGVLDKAIAAVATVALPTLKGLPEAQVTSLVDAWLTQVGIKAAKPAVSGAAGLM